jgi:hypothetical protein
VLLLAKVLIQIVNESRRRKGNPLIVKAVVDGDALN